LEYRSSLLSQMLRQGVGISMSLGLLYVAVARRVGLSCGLVAAVPSYVLVRVYGAGPSGEDGFVDTLREGALMKAADMQSSVGQLTRHICMQTSTPAVVFGRMLANVARFFEAALQRDPKESEAAWRLFGIYEQLLPLSSGSSVVPIKLKRVNLALRYPGDVLRQDAVMKDVKDVQELWVEAEDAWADPRPYESEADDDDETGESPRGLERSTKHDMLRDRSFRWSNPSSFVALLLIAALVLLGGLVPKLPTGADAPFELVGDCQIKWRGATLCHKPIGARKRRQQDQRYGHSLNTGDLVIGHRACSTSLEHGAATVHEIMAPLLASPARDAATLHDIVTFSG